MPRLFNSARYKTLRRKLRRDRSMAEIVLWRHLRQRRLCGHKFRRQQSIGRYVVDFYCPALKLAIEVDGDSHFFQENLVPDRQRQAWLERLGVRVVRVRNDEVMQDTLGVLERLINVVHLRASIGTPSSLPSQRGGGGDALSFEDVS